MALFWKKKLTKESNQGLSQDDRVKENAHAWLAREEVQHDIELSTEKSENPVSVSRNNNVDAAKSDDIKATEPLSMPRENTTPQEEKEAQQDSNDNSLGKTLTHLESLVQGSSSKTNVPTSTDDSLSATVPAVELAQVEKEFEGSHQAINDDTENDNNDTLSEPKNNEWSGLSAFKQIENDKASEINSDNTQVVQSIEQLLSEQMAGESTAPSDSDKSAELTQEQAFPNLLKEQSSAAQESKTRETDLSSSNLFSKSFAASADEDEPIEKTEANLFRTENLTEQLDNDNEAQKGLSEETKLFSKVLLTDVEQRPPYEPEPEPEPEPA